MKTIFARLMKDESGATAIEYGLIAALISVALIGGATALGDQLTSLFNNLSRRTRAARQRALAAKHPYVMRGGVSVKRRPFVVCRATLGDRLNVMQG